MLIVIRRLLSETIVFTAVAIMMHPSLSTAQDTRPGPQIGRQVPEVVSPEVSSDRKLTFRIQAPNAKLVKLSSSDLPGLGQGQAMEKSAIGVWELSLDAVESGAYRYNFDVDGIPVIDPKNPKTSEANSNTWSLVYVPGSSFADTQNVPHGSVSQVTYHSKSLGRFRRMHVYTPPGYESGEGKFPVFYLLHGAFDCDNSWSSVGRAGFILDNLIAAGKAKPMVVVMPTGHTSPFRFGPPSDNSLDRQVDEFTLDFVNDLKPYVEQHYRLHADRAMRAIVGLSMGGAQTLNIAIPNLKEYAYIGVFSSGVFGIVGGPGAASGPSWEEKQLMVLDDAELKKGLKLVWFATGKEDFLLATTKGTVDVLKKHHFDVVFEETEGGHTWINWRQYLNAFAPRLFQ